MSLQSKVAVFKKLRYRLLIYFVGALIFIMPARTALEHHFLYFPEPRHEATPAAVGLVYEEVAFQATDGTQLNGWLVPGRPDAPVVLFCMGNAGNISHRLETLQLLHNLGVAVFILNYRGYGLSEGKASEQGTYHDVAGALEFLHKRGWPPARTVIFGRSLGAAIGLDPNDRRVQVGTPTLAGLACFAAIRVKNGAWKMSGCRNVRMAAVVGAGLLSLGGFRFVSLRNYAGSNGAAHV